MNLTTRRPPWLSLAATISLLAGCGAGPATPSPAGTGPASSPAASTSGTSAPSTGASNAPSAGPTTLPTVAGSAAPTIVPSLVPTIGPTLAPTAPPTAAPTPTFGPPAIAWTRHVGTQAEDAARAIAADSGGIAIAGDTGGSMDGAIQGPSDAFLRWYDLSGNLRWGRQVGTSRQEWASDVSVDDGGITLLGTTDGSFSGTGGTNAKDLFLRRYDRDGNELWTRQYVTATDEDAGGMAADASGLTVVTTVQPPPSDTPTTFNVQVLVLRYDRSGNLAWTFDFGTSEQDEAEAIAIDAAGFTVGGATDGDMEGKNAGPYSDAFLRRYDIDRRLLWTRQWGQQGDDTVLSIAADDTGITAVGYTNADAFGNEPSQAFIRRYDRAGTLLWSQVFGTTESEIAWGVTADAGGLTVTGYTYGALDGTHAGGLDVFGRTWERSGNLVWRTQFGTSGAEIGIDVASDGRGITILGHTNGALGGASQGELDLFIRRYAR